MSDTRPSPVPVGHDRHVTDPVDPTPTRPIVLASNRGPVSFSLDPEGRPVGRRGAGGWCRAWPR